MPVLQKVQRISVHLKNDRDGNQLNYSNDLPEIRNKNYALQKFFETDFSTVIGNAKLRPSFVISWVAQGTRSCTLTYFLCKIICNYYFTVKFIEMYSLIFT